MDLKLAGKVALITGSSRGIGLATAKALAAEGCRLMLSARSAEPLAEAAAALHTSGVDVAAHPADVSKPDEAAGLVQAAVTAFGGIDVLINNVGGGGGGARIADSTDDDWRSAMERNLIQTVRMMRLALPHMQGRTGAAVINVASISGWSPQLAMSGQYGAAKAALIFDTERWALEFVPHGIRVNTVSPGSILVAGNGWDRYRLANQAYFDDYVRHGFPMGRLGTADGGGRCHRFPGVAARPLDQRPEHTGRRAGTTPRALGSPTILMFGEVLTAGFAGSPPASGVPNTLLRQNAQCCHTIQHRCLRLASLQVMRPATARGDAMPPPDCKRDNM